MFYLRSLFLYNVQKVKIYFFLTTTIIYLKYKAFIIYVLYYSTTLLFLIVNIYSGEKYFYSSAIN